jgi:hypothetical protein
VIHFVGIAFAEMERGGLEGGYGGCHVVVWLGLVRLRVATPGQVGLEWPGVT